MLTDSNLDRDWSGSALIGQRNWRRFAAYAALVLQIRSEPPRPAPRPLLAAQSYAALSAMCAPSSICCLEPALKVHEACGPAAITD